MKNAPTKARAFSSLEVSRPSVLPAPVQSQSEEARAQEPSRARLGNRRDPGRREPGRQRANPSVAFWVSTFAALAQVPLVLVMMNDRMFLERVYPSKVSIFWLKDPKPSSLPLPASLSAPGVKPMPALDPPKLPTVQLVAFTLTAAEPPFANKKVFAPFERLVKVMRAVVVLVRLTETSA